MGLGRKTPKSYPQNLIERKIDVVCYELNSMGLQRDRKVDNFELLSGRVRFKRNNEMRL